MSLKVLMVPHWQRVKDAEPSGIRTVVEAYFHHLPDYGIELVDSRANSFDLLAVHAGMTGDFPNDAPLVAHLHGLYWTADYASTGWEQEGNAAVIRSIRHASLVTVPSAWVGETLRRDMHMTPMVLPHGIDMAEWQHEHIHEDFVLWNKNRVSDVCNPQPLNDLARRVPQVRFLTTFAADNPTPNIREMGLMPPGIMKRVIQHAACYLATTKETFGIGTLEALAAGVPVLGYDWGGTAALVQHGVTGYLARPGDMDDLVEGLAYCLRHRSELSANAKFSAALYSWGNVAGRLAKAYADTVSRYRQPATTGVVIPCYNKAATLERAVNSVLSQTVPARRIVIVDDGSTDESADIGRSLAARHPNVEYLWQHNQGVASARNAGLYHLDTAYVAFLDADDEMMPEFIERTSAALDADPSLGLAYGRLEVVNERGEVTLSGWPAEYNFDGFLAGRNQVPTCCLLRRQLVLRVGGYRRRYAPAGAGSEDADLWLRMGAAGYGGMLASDRPLFRYHLGGATQRPGYTEPDWRAGKPWLGDGQHPFASLATPANSVAHLVRQYDEPDVSVIIPCSLAHLDTLVDALDSLEAQTFRKWEAIVVCDGFNPPSQLREAFPFVNWKGTREISGPGYTRNCGAEVARAPLLLFLDADDFLASNALARLVAAHMEAPQSILYSDYLGIADIGSQHEREKLRMHNRLVAHDERTGLSTIYYNSADYDCQQAQQQPAQDGRFYIWNLISSLTPRAYHEDIGGFDETMESWEDWDYWIRMARRGYCFERISEPLIVYRFGTGGRRAKANPEESGESGRQLAIRLLEYMQSKYAEGGVMGCRSCGGRRSSPSLPPQQAAAMMTPNWNEGTGKQMAAGEMVEVELIDGNYGDHLIAFQGTQYGYRSQGDRFQMLRAHAQLDRRVRIVEAQPLAHATQAAKRETPPPKFVEWADDKDDDGEWKAQGDTVLMEADESEEDKTDEHNTVIVPQIYNFSTIKGVGPKRNKMLVEAGVRSLDGLLQMEPAALAVILDIEPAAAKSVLAEAKKKK